MPKGRGGCQLLSRKQDFILPVPFVPPEPPAYWVTQAHCGQMLFSHLSNSDVNASDTLTDTLG